MGTVGLSGCIRCALAAFIPRSFNALILVMFRQTLSNTIHIRDFVDSIAPNPSREDSPNYVEIHAYVNIFEENNFFSHDIIVEPIHARIRAYLNQEDQDRYCPNAFFYAEGRFFTSVTSDNTLEMNVQALSLMSPRCFTIDTSVNDASKAGPVHFSALCFLEDTKRWEKVKTPSVGALLSITAKIAGRTAEENLLALRILDLGYLPRPASTAPVTTPVSAPPSKRAARWDGRAPATPSKKACDLDQLGEPSISRSSPPESTAVGPTSPFGSTPLSGPLSPVTAVCDDHDDSIPLPEPNHTSRPLRNRHLRRTARK
ncbi:hypothetical protein F5883DRAFT_697797 [Diaporthe sp. PMI_573]|nr:hypothetical protein F5883DRAFT_697797 [Diaporthaceae sp. PMI_573]